MTRAINLLKGVDLPCKENQYAIKFKVEKALSCLCLYSIYPLKIPLLQVHFDLLIGADGVNSSVRHFLEQNLPSFEGQLHSLLGCWSKVSFHTHKQI